MALDRFTQEQIEQIKKIEDFRVAKGLAGYKDFFEAIKSSLMENDGLTPEDLEKYQGSQKTIAAAQELFTELLAACKQVLVDPDFTEDNWPLEPIEPNEDEWEVFEHKFPIVMTLEQGIQHLEEMAAKGKIHLLTGSRRAMKWIAEHPRYPIGECCYSSVIQ